MAKATKAKADVSALKSKEARQTKQIQKYKNQRRWTAWAGGLILALILLLLLTMGYATNWGINPTRTSSFQPTSGADTANTSGNATQPATTSGGGSTSSNGATDSGSTTRSTTTNTTPGNSSTTTNNSTTNTSTTTNNTTTKPGPTSSLLQVLDDAIQGTNLDTIIDEAKNLGLSVDCSVQLAIIRTCNVSDGGNSVTLKAPILNNLLSGVSTSF